MNAQYHVFGVAVKNSVDLVTLTANTCGKLYACCKLYWTCFVKYDTIVTTHREIVGNVISPEFTG